MQISYVFIRFHVYIGFLDTTFDLNNNETVYPIWNKTAGSDSTPSVSNTYTGNYYSTEISSHVFDKNVGIMYTSYGVCNTSFNTICGVNTDFYLTPQHGTSLIIGLQVCTGPTYATRDPISITFEGSNLVAAILNIDSSGLVASKRGSDSCTIGT
ncbi:unnamed protein product [Rotaria socialis]|uniref:Uncharacterized protein n=1 Tax=Rotaria socialis TaxID=392032 RepID=A0A820CUG1_9BILA|nr:unnamed protein product [Rotaria socialis]CAF4228586.1 unnamed protein product [Rotaria socialis]